MEVNKLDIESVDGADVLDEVLRFSADAAVLDLLSEVVLELQVMTFT